MQEFIYYNTLGLEFPISEKIFVTSNLEDTKNQNFLISNSKDVNSDFLASEIDFYIINSQDNLSKKIKNILELYEAAAVKFDLSKDIPQNKQISNSLLIITSSKEQYESFTSGLERNDFDLFKADISAVKQIDGTIGEFKVTVFNGIDIILNVSQIVWFDENLAKKRVGIYDPNILGIDAVIKILKDNKNYFSYKNFTTYDPSICQYHDRKLGDVCSACEKVCPTFAITKDDKNKQLVFSHIDCVSCGQCVSVCPSGALDSSATSRDSLFEISSFYKAKHPLIISTGNFLGIDIENLSVSLKEDVFPLAINGDILDESTLLTLLQVSGSQIVYFTQNISHATKEAIVILNDIYQRRFNTNAVIVATTQDELKIALEDVKFVDNSYFNFNQKDLKKREVFSQRLQKIVGDDDLGTVKTGKYVHYGRVLVNEAICTLCLACVQVCNVDALVANESDFSLRVNPSLCTACGYCEVVCPENGLEKECLTITTDEIVLNPSWFRENILAHDELFACIECGKKFATKKSIEKIASMMAPIFATVSETKKRTLYCCEDCKAKLMIKEGLLNA